MCLARAGSRRKYPEDRSAAPGAGVLSHGCHVSAQGGPDDSGSGLGDLLPPRSSVSRREDLVLRGVRGGCSREGTYWAWTCVNRQDKLIQLALDPTSWRSFMHHPTSPAIPPSPQQDNPIAAAPVSTQKSPLSCSASQAGLLGAKPVWVQPRAANSKKWPLIKSQMWTFPNWKRSVSDLNFTAHAAFCKNRALASPELL